MIWSEIDNHHDQTAGGDRLLKGTELSCGDLELSARKDNVQVIFNLCEQTNIDRTAL
jgi:hypothetical protein